MGHLPTTAQFNRLAALGVTDAERAVLAQQGHDRIYVADLINDIARWPLGPDGLRHYRLFHEYPGAADALDQVDEADRNAITAWRHVAAVPAKLEAVFTVGAWERLPYIAALADDLADIASGGMVNAVQNPVIEWRIERATVALAGYASAARGAGRLDGADYAHYVAPVPERLRRAGRQWRSLAGRQYSRALYRWHLRHAVGWR